MRASTHASAGGQNSLNEGGLTFSLRRPSLSFAEFELFVKLTRSLVQDVSRAAAGTDGGWVLTNLAYGSAAVATAPSTLDGNAHSVETSIVTGISEIEVGLGKPSFFGERALKSARRLGLLSGESALLVSMHGGPEAELTRRAVGHVDGLLRPARRYFGSIVGDCDAISVHRRPVGTVYGDNGVVVKCYFSEAQLEIAKPMLGRRVVVSGQVYVNHLGNMLTINSDEVLEAPRRTTRPPGDFFGAMPDFTGGLSISDYLAEGRGSIV